MYRSYFQLTHIQRPTCSSVSYFVAGKDNRANQSTMLQQTQPAHAGVTEKTTYLAPICQHQSYTEEWMSRTDSELAWLMTNGQPPEFPQSA